MVEFVASSIIGEVDKQNARVRIMNRKTCAKSQRECILSIAKRMTAGKLVLDGRCFHLNGHVLEQAEQRHNQKQQELKEKQKKADFIYLELCAKADDAIRRNSHCSEVSKWKRSRDILAFIRPLKTIDDNALPTRRSEIINRYNQWKHRSRRNVDANTVEEFKNNIQKNTNIQRNERDNNESTNNTITANAVAVKTENVEGQTEV